MKPTTRIAIAQLLSAAGSVLTAFAAEFNGSEAEAGTATPEGVTPDPAKKRGRRAAATATDTAGEATGATAVETPAEPAAPTKTYEDMKAVIKPFVDAGRGLEVKATIAKFAPSLREMDPQHYAAFEAAMAALPAKTEEY